MKIHDTEIKVGNYITFPVGEVICRNLRCKESLIFEIIDIYPSSNEIEVVLISKKILNRNDFTHNEFDNIARNNVGYILNKSSIIIPTINLSKKVSMNITSGNQEHIIDQFDGLLL